jgi:hypothetical protein
MSFSTPPFRSFLLAVCGSAAQFPPASIPEIALAGRSNVGEFLLLLPQPPHSLHSNLQWPLSASQQPMVHLTRTIRKIIPAQFPRVARHLLPKRRILCSPRQVQRHPWPNSDHQFLRLLRRPRARPRQSPSEARDVQAGRSAWLRCAACCYTMRVQVATAAFRLIQSTSRICGCPYRPGAAVAGASAILFEVRGISQPPPTPAHLPHPRSTLPLQRTYLSRTYSSTHRRESWSSGVVPLPSTAITRNLSLCPPLPTVPFLSTPPFISLFQRSDAVFASGMLQRRLPFSIVLTKVDRLSISNKSAAPAAAAAAMLSMLPPSTAATWGDGPRCFAVSSKSGSAPCSPHKTEFPW